MEEDQIKELQDRQAMYFMIYLWGAIWGWVIGMIFTKVYQLWVYGIPSRIFLTYSDYPYNFPSFSFRQFAERYPLLFHFVTVAIFVILGLLFARFLLHNFIKKK